MSPVPAAGTELTPQLLLCWRRPRGCLPRSEQILRSIQLLKESFCCYSAFPCVCGAARAPRLPAPPLTPSQTRGWVSPRDAAGGGLLCPSALIPSVPVPHLHPPPDNTTKAAPSGGVLLPFIGSLKRGLFRCVVGAGRFTAGFVPVASRPSSAPEQEQVRCN